MMCFIVQQAAHQDDPLHPGRKQIRMESVRAMFMTLRQTQLCRTSRQCIDESEVDRLLQVPIATMCEKSEHVV